jgi:hypothetical protein
VNNAVASRDIPWGRRHCTAAAAAAVVAAAMHSGPFRRRQRTSVKLADAYMAVTQTGRHMQRHNTDRCSMDNATLSEHRLPHNQDNHVIA